MNNYIIKLPVPNCLYTSVYNALRDVDYRWDTVAGTITVYDEQTYTKIKKVYEETDCLVNNPSGVIIKAPEGCKVKKKLF